jgi:hypothetical protein
MVKPVWFVVNEVSGSRALLRGRVTLGALHTEWRMVPVTLPYDVRDLVLIEEYAWLLDEQGRQRKDHQHSRLVPADMGLEEWFILSRPGRKGSVAFYDDRTPVPVLPDGAYVYASWNKHYPVKTVTVEEVIEYATA